MPVTELIWSQHINFVFPAQAIWAADIWGSDEKRPYPAPMVLLTTLLARRANDPQAYKEIVVPFLDRLTMGFQFGVILQISLCR